MGAVSVPFGLTDEMTAPLNRIISSIDTMIASMSKVEGVSNEALMSAQNDIRSASAQLTAVNEKMSATGTQAARASKSTGGFVSSMKSMVGMVGGLWAVRKGFSMISGSIETAMNRTQQETKLATIMQERMKTKDTSGVTSVMNKQTQTGVIGSTTQMQGAQQMATFLNQKKSLETLIPAMNNLAVQQKGVNATGDDMKNIGNMIGKVMRGQTGALRRVGISFSSAEEKALKYGNEQERAATLAKVITNNVGSMNQAIAKTPQGQMAQMKNNLAAVKLQIGQAILPSVIRLIQTLSTSIPAIKIMAQGFAVVVSGVASALSGVARVVSTVISRVGALFGKTVNFKTMSKAVSGITKALLVGATALVAYKGILAIVNTVQALSAARAAIASGATLTEAAATTTATGAQIGMNIAMLACPITWIVAGIAVLIGVIVLLVTHWKKVKEIFAPLGAKLKAIGGWFTSLGGKLKSIFGKVGGWIAESKEKFKGWFDNVKSGMKKTGEGIKGWFSDKFHKGMEAAKTVMHSFATSTDKRAVLIRKYLKGINEFISGVFTGNWRKAWKGVKDIFSSIWEGIKDAAKRPINAIIGFINTMISGINKIGITIPNSKLIPKKFRGVHIGWNLPSIPALAKGTDNFGGGPALIGEKGPEILNLPKGSSVTPNNKIPKGTIKSIIVNKLADTMVIREEADIDKVASAMADKLEDIADLVPA